MRGKGLVVLALPLLALLVVGVASLTLQLQERDARHRTLVTNGLINAADATLRAGVDVETAVRGYALTSDPTFLGPAANAGAAEASTLRALRLAASAAKRPEAGTAIASAYTTAVGRLVVIRDRAAGEGRTVLDRQLRYAKSAMDVLRARVAATTAEQSRLLVTWRRQITTLEHVTEAVDIGGLGLGVLTGLAGVLLLGSGITRRLDAVAADARRLGLGQPLVGVVDADDELGRLAASLADTAVLLDQRSAELLAARDEALEATQAKSRFLSRTSHELRTPLNAVLGFAQLLSLSELTDDNADNVAQIIRAGRHLLSLLNEVLDVSRIEAGDMTFSLEPVPVPFLAAEVAELMRPLAAERDVTIEQCCGSRQLAVRADRQRLNQILLNLVSNAVKYNHRGGSVVIDCRSLSPALTAITVADRGPGLTPQQLERIFLPFDRAGAEGSGIEGTGIGLTLTKALTEAMGGRLLVTSTPGEGSTFTVELPAAADIDLDAPPPVPAGGAGAQGATAMPQALSVLSIEDNLANLQVLRRLLASRPDTSLFAALTGQLGIDLARQHRPNVILLDLHLPDLAGEEVLDRLRADPSTASIPVVVLSADATERTPQRLLAGGATAFLSKPIDLRQLIGLLDGLSGAGGSDTSPGTENLSSPVHQRPIAPW